MNITGNLSGDSISLLQLRGRTADDITSFSAVLMDAQARLSDNESAKEVLSSMSKQDLQQVQHAAGLVDRIQVASLSNEGALNLLSQPDKSDMVDLNNDGLVEVGVSRAIVFPPVNAPNSVKAAWDDATQGMTEQDKLVMELHMHTAVYGVHMDGISSKDALPPSEQWSDKGVEQLFDQLKSALAFAVSLDGWTSFNQTKRDFYESFEYALASSTDAKGREAEGFDVAGGV